MSFFSFQDIISCITGIMLIFTLLLILQLINRPEQADASPRDSLPDLVALNKQIQDAEEERDGLKKRVKDNREKLDEYASGISITPQRLEKLRKRVAVLHGNKASEQSQVQELKKEQERVAVEVKAARTDTDELRKKLREQKRRLDAERKKTRVTLLGGQASTKRPLLVECSAEEVRVGQVDASGVTQELRHFSGAATIRDFLRWAKGRDNTKEYFVLLMRPDAAGEFDGLTGSLRTLGFESGWDVWPPAKQLFGEKP